MKATIVNFRTARHHQTYNQMVLKAEGIADKEAAGKLVGKKVTYKCVGKSGKTISGQITGAHGNSGALKARFDSGLPGQAIGTSIEIN
ncbi:MAG: 50S ribosomal protein L35ae [Candidatus Woesearchaeota archaeon]